MTTTLTIKGVKYTDCNLVSEVTGNVKAPNGTVGSVTLSVYEMLNVSGDVNDYSVKVVGFGKEKIVDHLTLDAANAFVSAATCWSRECQSQQLDRSPAQ